MDPVQKIWMYENWIADQNDQVDLAKNHAYLLASFSHPDAVKQILGDGNTHISTDEEFEETSKMVLEANRKVEDNKKIRKRKNRKLKG
jgi:hypothetical protein